MKKQTLDVDRMTWQRLDSIRLHSYRLFTTRRDRCRSPVTEREHDFYILECADWINVIPLTPQREVVLVRQFRHGVRETTLEIPGGVIEPGEEPAAAAQRELREETGYVAEQMLSLGFTYPNPAIQENRCHLFLAEGAQCVGAQDLDETEEIQVVRLPLARVLAMIATGELDHALMLAAFARFLLRPAARAGAGRGRSLGGDCRGE
jgi:8-oxo-dGTP pyrophosphatase MutT (NUDIX family)